MGSHQELKTMLSGIEINRVSPENNIDPLAPMSNSKSPKTQHQSKISEKNQKHSSSIKIQQETITDQQTWEDPMIVDFGSLMLDNYQTECEKNSQHQSTNPQLIDEEKPTTNQLLRDHSTNQDPSEFGATNFPVKPKKPSVPLRSKKYSRTFDDSSQAKPENPVLQTISSNLTHKTNMITVDEEFYFESDQKDNTANQITSYNEKALESKTQLTGYRQSAKDTFDDSVEID